MCSTEVGRDERGSVKGRLVDAAGRRRDKDGIRRGHGVKNLLRGASGTSEGRTWGQTRQSRRASGWWWEEKATRVGAKIATKQGQENEVNQVLTSSLAPLKTATALPAVSLACRLGSSLACCLCRAQCTPYPLPPRSVARRQRLERNVLYDQPDSVLLIAYSLFQRKSRAAARYVRTPPPEPAGRAVP
jgi:hypothetical protein